MTNPKAGSDVVFRVTPAQLRRCFPKMRRQERFFLIGGGVYFLLSVLLTTLYAESYLFSHHDTILRISMILPFVAILVVILAKLAIKKDGPHWWTSVIFALLMLVASYFSLSIGAAISAAV